MSIIENADGFWAMQKFCPVEALESVQSPRHVGDRTAIPRGQARSRETDATGRSSTLFLCLFNNFPSAPCPVHSFASVERNIGLEKDLSVRCDSESLDI